MSFFTLLIYSLFIFSRFFYELLYAFKYGISILFKNEMERSTQLSYFKVLPFLACKCGIENTRRIVGGTEVNPVRPYNFLLLNQLSIIFSSKVNKYPWMVRLSVEFGNGYGSYCGGTLVASRYVITAAHCVEFKEIEVTPDMITV